jgi:hypothetical protein
MDDVAQVGSNDVNATLSDRSALSYQRWKKLPSKPDRVMYRDAMIAIIDRLLSQTSAQIGICSLTPLGEQLDTECQHRIVEYNGILKGIVDSYVTSGRVTYIPIYEALVAVLAKTKLKPHYSHAPQRTALLNFKVNIITTLFDLSHSSSVMTLIFIINLCVQCLIMHYIFGRSWDAISKSHGMLLLTDCLHINSMAGHIIATTIQQWIESLPIS